MSALSGGKDTRTALLSLSLISRDGDSVLGNVFIVVEHEASGQKWRGLRYHLKTKSYIYSALPEGRFRFRVVAAGYRSKEGQVDLREGASQSVAVLLSPETPNAPLLINVGADIAEYEQFSRLLHSRRDVRDRFGVKPAEMLQRHFEKEDQTTSIEKPNLSIQSELLAALICDTRVIDALSQPIYLLTPNVLAEWLESRLLTAWKFDGLPARERIVRPLVEQRVRFYVLVKALVHNRLIGARLHCPDESELTLHILRFLASLDSPNLDAVIPILVQLLDPELAPVEKLARALLQCFNARVPTGAAVPNHSGLLSAKFPDQGSFELDLNSLSKVLIRDEAAKMLVSTPATEGADLEERVTALMFLLAEIGHCVAGALGHSTSYIEGLLKVRDYQ